MGWKPWAALAGFIALAAPIVALTQSPPQVILATPGSAGGAGGVVDRFTMRFSEAMVPLGDPRATPPIAMKCAVAGTGRWVDPQTFVHEFAKPLPGGISCEAKLRQDLASARGVAVTGQRDFTIDTGGPSARAVLPATYDGDIEEDQVFLVAANVAPTRSSIAAAGYCAVDGIGERIALDILPAETAPKLLSDLGTENWSVRNFLEEAGLPQNIPANATDRATAYRTVVAVKCRRPLPPGRDMALVWGGNVASADGRLAGKDERFDFSVRKDFTARIECARVNPQAGCNPLRPVRLRFTSPVPKRLADQTRLNFPDGTSLAPKYGDEDKNAAFVSDLEFANPMPSAVTAKAVLPAGLTDESGRRLANAARFPLDVRIDTTPPIVKFAADFGIIEAKEGGVLPVTVRGVEPGLMQRVSAVKGQSLRVEGSDGHIAKWLRDLDDADDSDIRTETVKGEEVDVNYTGTTSLLNGKGEGLQLALPGKGKEFEVVGIPLSEPGFYVVELASPALGRVLLGRSATRYVAAGALVTNMAVHFKWGREASLAWVTSLDSGAVVAGADVRVTDSCTGRTLARGQTDRNGTLIIRSGLPEPETYGGCSEGSDAHPLMISARSGDDFSFTLTEWSQGIRPYDFDLSFGYSAPEDIVHTVFDRSLVREGEAINMKHILRRPVGAGFAYPAGFTGKLVLTHSGSGTEFELPATIGGDGVGENQWTVPKGAPQGDYSLAFKIGKDRTIYSGQDFRVDEYRLPTMRAAVTGPKSALVRPVQIPLDLFVGYLSGGGAAGLPVNIRTAYDFRDSAPEGWDDWTFGGRPVKEGLVPLSSDNEEPDAPLPLAQTLPATLGGDGTGKVSIEPGLPIEAATTLTVEMDYEDANGETLTTSRRIPLFPSAIQLGIKTDGWLMRDSDLRLKLVTLDAEANPVRGRTVRVDVYSREILTSRRRLIGGFYAYDNQARTTKLSASCSATSDAQGLAACSLAPGVSGEVTVVATTTDADGNVARAVRSVWLAGEDDWWFGGDNGDRMDLVPEAKSYPANGTARFQVRMPFREATALVTVEREGVLSSFVTQLSGKDPVVEVPLAGSYAPDVHVSVLAVRGRVSGFKTWVAQKARELDLPFFEREGAAPTALVDLAKPSYRLGMARIDVGWEGHKLQVAVKADKKRYAIRDTANVDVAVKGPGGKPPASAEMAFVAVDEALLQLSPNESWKLIEAMMGDRPVSVLTSTAQMQVVGKRTYGRKAVEAGGGGGGDMSGVTRDDFKPVLLWQGRVNLDSKGRAKVAVPLSDALTQFRLVAIAQSGPDQFGTGETSIRTAQDLQIFSGLPPLVRTGDQYAATFTLRNGSDKAMKVTATARLNPSIATGPPLTVEIPAGGAVPVTWNLTAPDAPGTLAWVVEAKSGKATDRIAVSQEIAPAVPVEVWAATLVRVGNGVPIPVAAPAGALPGSGIVDVKLTDTLAPPLAGVRDYMSGYPYSCFEQRLSKAVVLGDEVAWTALGGEIPAYIDSDGLLRYFPMDQLRGSEALTAYALSMTAEAGFVIPDASKQRMIAAMKSVLDGRLERETPWRGDMRLNRIAALAALARNGAATPAMLASIRIVPADMPTTALADWLAAIDRTKGANAALRVEAEKALRQRLVYEGSRLDLADQSRAPWWMMSSGDEMAIKALVAALGRPGWTDEAPKMMVGVALRQKRGHWDTTTANAWGTIAARRFGTLYPATAVRGTTTVSLAGESATQSWPMLADAGPLRLKLPAAQTPLTLAQSGGAGPWALVSVLAAVPLTDPLFAGYRLVKEVTVISRKFPDRLTRGDVVKVRLTVEASAERNWVVINDPVPPGATIIGGLGGQSALLARAASGGEGAYPSYVERKNDSWRGYFEWVPRGRLVTEYAMRLNGAGQFRLPPTRVEAMYSPDIRAQVPNAPVTVALR